MKHIARCELRVSNLDCEHDALAIRRALKGAPGLVELQVYPKSAKLRLVYDAGVTALPQLRDQLRAAGFTPHEDRLATARPRPWRDPKVVTSALSGLLLLVGWLAGRWGAVTYLVLGPYVASAVLGAWYFGQEAVQDVVFERRIGIELLMTVAAVLAMAMGELAEGAMLAFLYSMSEAAEGYTEAKTRSAVRGLMDLTPKRAIVRRDGIDTDIPVEDVAIGDVFIVKPGGAVATDGLVTAGMSAVNQAPVTGESVPVEKQSGDSVFAGSINTNGLLEVRATKTFADNTIARIIEMVEEAQEKKGASQRFIERFGSRYSPVVLLGGFAIAVGAPLLLGAAWLTALSRATVFIVAAAPCALVISIPITLVAALGTGARNGVLIKGGLFVEKLARINAVAFDKTGTLTEGRPEVTDVLAFDTETDDEVLRLAAALEAGSEHPVAKAVLDAARARGLRISQVSQFSALVGRGVRGTVEGQPLVLGNERLARELGLYGPVLEVTLARFQRDGKTAFVLATTNQALGVIAVADRVRDNARSAVQHLRETGITRLVMLTGDNEETARAIAAQIGLQEYRAGLLPDEKVKAVRALEAAGQSVLFVGDGVNDAPALAEASVGVAMGAAGTDVALETADVALMADNLEKLVYALHLARRTQRVVTQNLALSAVVIGVLVVGALAGWFSLPVAVLAHEISEFVVIGSGLRMLRT